MDQFYEILKEETRRQRNLLNDNLKIQKNSPPGFLFMRTRRRSLSFYWISYRGKGSDKKQTQLNITGDNQLISKLINKAVSAKAIKHINSNLSFMDKLLSRYQDTSPAEIAKCCSKTYRQAFAARRRRLLDHKTSLPYRKCPYNPQYHKHETDSGELVRSKSEQIIANALYTRHIPFHYEEEFIHGFDNHPRIYADFTIYLPDGNTIIWEHLGMLSKEEYCIHNAKKLNVYQMSGFVIGRNLILTMDDNRGNISSSIINHNIEHIIYPRLQKI